LAHDYRYFPDPDLAPVEIDDAWLDRCRTAVRELPLARRSRLRETYQLGEEAVEAIVAERRAADLFESAISAGGPADIVAKQFVNYWLKGANDRGTAVHELDVSADRMGGLAKLVGDGTLSASAAATIAEAMLDSPDAPDVLADKLGLVKVVDKGETEGWVEEAFAANEQAVADAKSNPKKAKAAAGFLRGQVMRISGGKADPKLVGELIEQRLAE
jgi:aspartyl-tRNA(Asn)/glutamyl-tRNA(Gln) amidotransferase subunit B